MRQVLIVVLLALPSVAFAQGCGSSNPNCIVPTRPLGDNTNAAASTAFVQANGGSGTALLSGSNTWTGSNTWSATNTWTASSLWSGTATFAGPLVFPGTGFIYANGASAATYSALAPASLGGTGAASLTAHGVVISEGANPMVPVTTSSTGQCLLSNGAASDPTWGSCLTGSTVTAGYGIQVSGVTVSSPLIALLPQTLGGL